MIPAKVIKPSRVLIEALQKEVAKLPQLELQTNHYFADGMYCREVARSAGVLIIGKVHKREHFYIVTMGKVRVTTETGVRDVSAPAVIVSQPGTKRAVYALEDSVCLTVHRTSETDFAVIERELLEDDETALFDSRNKLIANTKLLQETLE